MKASILLCSSVDLILLLLRTARKELLGIGALAYFEVLLQFPFNLLGQNYVTCRFVIECLDQMFHMFSS